LVALNKMKNKIKFILNNKEYDIEINPATVVLDFIRSERLCGTKEGCKEGDCGACTLLVGELVNDEVFYKPVNSCLLPVGNIHGKHIATIEGINIDNRNLNLIQQAFVDEGATQCGFCTPGFIISLTGYFLNENNSGNQNVINALDGNICRCTGHNSIIRAAEKVSGKLKNAFTLNGTKLKYLTENKIIPEYFLTIKNRLQKIETENIISRNSDSEKNYFVSGGTDLFVQRPDEMFKSNVKLLQNDKSLFGIKFSDGYCVLGGNTSVTEIQTSEIFKKHFPDIDRFMELFGSTPIRNSATIGGNLNNASPIGDMTSFFLALNSIVILSDGKSEREIPLNKYYLSYKKTDRRPDEFMKSLKFKLPKNNYYFNFEKVSKRTYLDIASVNSTVLLNLKNNIIIEIHLSAGGVSAIPLYLFKTCEFLISKELNLNNIKEAVSIAQSEIAPISDARGNEDYKRLLLSRLIYTHFITLFPEKFSIEDTL